MILALLTVLMSFAGSSATEHNAFKPAPATGSSTYTVKSHKPPAPWKSSHKGGTGPPPADYPAFQLYARTIRMSPRSMDPGEDTAIMMTLGNTSPSP